MPSSSSLAGIRLLLVDNDSGVSTLLRAWFEHLGAQVACAESAERGLERLEGEERPDLVLLDLRMPGIGGLGFLEKGRDLPPVLVCSGFVAAEEAARIEGHPAVRGILRKPFDLPNLTAAVERALASESCAEGGGDPETRAEGGA